MVDHLLIYEHGREIDIKSAIESETTMIDADVIISDVPLAGKSRQNGSDASYGVTIAAFFSGKKRSCVYKII